MDHYSWPKTKARLFLVLFNPVLRRIAVLRRYFYTDIMSPKILCSNCGRAGTHEWIENDFCIS